MTLTGNLIVDLAIIFIVCTVLGLILRAIKLPLILAYFLAGILLTPILGSNNLDLLQLSELGVAFLLFIAGLELDLNLFKKIRKDILYIGFGQVIITTFLAYVVSEFFFSSIESILIAIALTFSSTVIAIKFLSDKGQLGTLHGKIAIGALLIQDLVAIVTLIFITEPKSLNGSLIFLLIKVILFILISIFLYKYGVKILYKAARSQEMLFITSLGILFFLIFLSLFFKFSVAIGAFTAGLVIASATHYNIEIAAKSKYLRDFFIPIFFVVLGTQVIFTGSKAFILSAIVLSILVLVAKPMIIYYLMRYLNYGKRVSFFSGILLAQISEFSFILIALAYSLKLIDREILSVVSLIAIITISASTYMTEYTDQLYSKLSRLFPGLKERTKLGKIESDYNTLLVGYDDVGQSIVENLKNRKILVVDHDPEIIKKIGPEKNIHYIYGDISNPELLNTIEFRKINLILSTILNKNETLVLLEKIKRTNKKCRTIVSAQDRYDADEFYRKGADHVVIPRLAGWKAIASGLKQKTKFER